jgi:hypothetical protein
MTFNAQELINSGMAWKLEGSIGRQCMAAIESGHAMLGRDDHRDYWGNHVPSRDQVKPGTKGSFDFVADRHGVEYAEELAGVE